MFSSLAYSLRIRYLNSNATFDQNLMRGIKYSLVIVKEHTDLKITTDKFFSNYISCIQISRLVKVYISTVNCFILFFSNSSFNSIKRFLSTSTTSTTDFTPFIIPSFEVRFSFVFSTRTT